MPGYLRYLRIAFSAACLIACVMLIFLWVRSYSSWVVVSGNKPYLIGFDSVEGELLTWLGDSGFRGRLSLETYPIDKQRTAKLRHNAFGFWFEEVQGAYLIVLPYWFLVILTVALAALPWLRWRFSLRTLLVATTLVAVVLGLIVWSSTIGL